MFSLEVLCPDSSSPLKLSGLFGPITKEILQALSSCSLHWAVPLSSPSCRSFLLCFLSLRDCCPLLSDGHYPETQYFIHSVLFDCFEEEGKSSPCYSNLVASGSPSPEVVAFYLEPEHGADGGQSLHRRIWRFALQLHVTFYLEKTKPMGHRNTWWLWRWLTTVEKLIRIGYMLTTE